MNALLQAPLAFRLEVSSIDRRIAGWVLGLHTLAMPIGLALFSAILDVFRDDCAVV